MPNYEESEAQISMPFDTLSEFQSSDEEVRVFTNNGNRVRGELKAWDKHINVVLKTSNGLSFIRGGSLERIDLSTSKKISDL